MDIVDVTMNRQETLDAMALTVVSNTVSQMPKGHAGHCDKCGNESARLMNAAYFKGKGLYGFALSIEDGICPPCRDLKKLP